MFVSFSSKGVALRYATHIGPSGEVLCTESAVLSFQSIVHTAE